MATTLDGMASGIGTNVTSYTVTLTTTQANNIICVLVYSEGGGSDPAPTITSITASGLTFTKRSVAPGIRSATELWWAVSASALAAKVITINLSGTYDDSAAIAFGVSGCNTAAPWDGNIGLSQVSTSAGPIAASFSAVNTTQANDFLIFGWGSAAPTANAIGTVPTSFTAITHRQNTGGAQYAAVAAAYRPVSASQINQTFTWGSTIPGTTPASDFLFDALTADAGGTSGMGSQAGPVNARLSQMALEVLRLPTAVNARVSQMAIEVLRPNVALGSAGDQVQRYTVNG